MRVLKRLSLYATLAAVFWAGAFGIAYGVTEWRTEQKYVGFTESNVLTTELSADMRCEAAVRIFETASFEWQRDNLNELLADCGLNGQ